ncbi:MAG TPA: hypothetical protein VFI27_11730 [candidate division Zixibacteria bacterium]|nr:hypothetical protein [candidate division Zixibacteria bacterium]
MEKQTIVALLGNSMMMDGIAVSLAENEEVISLRLDPSTMNLQERLLRIKPDLILYELDSDWAHTILSLLSEQPGTLLLALDADCSRVIIMNSRQRLTKSMEELYQLFQDEVDLAPRT